MNVECGCAVWEVMVVDWFVGSSNILEGKCPCTTKPACHKQGRLADVRLFLTDKSCQIIADIVYD
eukprot:scaffold257494_cov30-Tisochrysis_lutea.AAC.1